jgi:hypothetical protein
MRRMTPLLILVVLALFVAAPTGATARQVHITINDSFQDDFLTEQCGVDVFIDVVGDLQVTLVYNRSGLIVREIDRAGGGRITYRSPETGNAFSFPIQPSQWDYGSGAVLGSPVVVSFTGLMGHVPGFIDSDAGLFRFLGIVEGFDEFGIPEVEFQEVIADRGNRNSGEEIVAAICAELTGS